MWVRAGSVGQLPFRNNEADGQQQVSLYSMVYSPSRVGFRVFYIYTWHLNSTYFNVSCIFCVNLYNRTVNLL